ncbi:MAG: hypothetical protein FWD62_13000 [Betaproteobacteria bacterium]|nr:hypothetical protein [Betaproteobacteria bacterium]
MTTPARARIRLTSALLMWASADLLGLVMLACGGAYLLRGAGLFGLSFPDTAMQAGVTIVLGLGLVVVAAIKMLAEIFKQMPSRARTGPD